MLLRRFQHVNYNILACLRMNNSYVTGLKLKNSLTNELEQFVPMDGNTIKWYTCGPTVYSHSHMGHARNYVCNDMIRRVLKNHFKYNVKFGMNITDVEDKIINNSRDQGIEYFQFAKKWEKEFFEDMGNLGVQVPDYLTRVTEYMPEIIRFIEKIIENGYAYESNKSVYFDIENYRKKFKYGKLKRVPEAQTEAKEQDEQKQKRNEEDFVLWKAAKPGEPTWTSKWGEGRPGWHIECSAMASEILGQSIDIHSGGIDLIFPHHENELAQSEAHFNKDKWIKYFIHVGHLHIDGLKMSKSKKNFITIKELVKHVDPRIIRLFFFKHRYDVPLDYFPEQSLQQTEKKDKRYKDFFGTLKATIRDMPLSAPQKMTQNDFEFDDSLQKTKVEIHEAFCNNINTPGVLKAIDDQLKKVNTYLTGQAPKILLLTKALEILNEAMQSMGLSYLQSQDSNSKEKQLMDSIAKFRDGIRQNAKSDFKTILALCDNFRDEQMVELGIRLEDKQVGQPSIWKYEAKEVLIREREKKEEDRRKKQEEKKKKQEQKLKKMSINPNVMFRNEAKYTQFDQDGIPTHQKDKEKDKPINDKLKNKLRKDWNNQMEQYKKYLQLTAGQEKKEEPKQQAEEPKKQQ